MNDPARSATRALMLVPTRELSEQVTGYLHKLLVYCDKEISVANIASGATTHLQKCVVDYDNLPSCIDILCFRSLLADNPDIVIATPSRALGLLQSKVNTSTPL